MYGICSVSYTLFATDAAAGKIKVMTSFTGTANILSHLGILYDSFSIACKRCTSQLISPEQVSQRFNKVNEYIKSMARNVKETN